MDAGATFGKQSETHCCQHPLRPPIIPSSRELSPNLGLLHDCYNVLTTKRDPASAGREPVRTQLRCCCQLADETCRLRFRTEDIVPEKLLAVVREPSSGLLRPVWTCKWQNENMHVFVLPLRKKLRCSPACLWHLLLIVSLQPLQLPSVKEA